MGDGTRRALGYAESMMGSVEAQLLLDRIVVRQLAEQIEDEAHLNTILAQTTPDLRDEVRALIVPYLRFPLTETT